MAPKNVFFYEEPTYLGGSNLGAAWSRIHPLPPCPRDSYPTRVGYSRLCQNFRFSLKLFYLSYYRAYVPSRLRLTRGNSCEKSNWRYATPRLQSALILALEQSTSPWQTLLVCRNYLDEIRPLTHVGSTCLSPWPALKDFQITQITLIYYFLQERACKLPSMKITQGQQGTYMQERCHSPEKEVSVN